MRRPILRRGFLGPSAIVLAVCWSMLGASFSTSTRAEQPTPLEKAFVPSEEFQTFVTALARENIPAEYERKKNWGATKAVMDGLDVDLRGLRLDTKRRWKDVNHGTWQQYRVTQIDPEQNLAVRIEEVREADGGQVQCRISATARMHCFGRQTQWERGVQVYSISAEAEAAVKLTARAILKPRIDPSSFPPDLILLVSIDQADLEIQDFRLQRVSHFDGPVVKSLSKTVREVIEDVVAEKRPELVAKINRKLEKEQDKLRLKWADVLKTPWGDLAEKLVSE